MVKLVRKIAFLPKHYYFHHKEKDGSVRDLQIRETRAIMNLDPLQIDLSKDGIKEPTLQMEAGNYKFDLLPSKVEIKSVEIATLCSL